MLESLVGQGRYKFLVKVWEFYLKFAAGFDSQALLIILSIFLWPMKKQSKFMSLWSVEINYYCFLVSKNLSGKLLFFSHGW